MTEIYTEDTFSPSSWTGTEWCGSPSHWHAVDDEATELEVTEMVATLVRATQPEFVLETGAYTGQTTQAIGKALKKNGHGRLIATELDEERAKQARTRCRGLPVTVESKPVAGIEFPEDPIDFAFIDAGTDRIAELRTILHRFRDGALIVIHDAAPHHRVWDDVEPLIAEGRLTALRLRTPRGVGIAQVPIDPAHIIRR